MTSVPSKVVLFGSDCDGHRPDTLESETYRDMVAEVERPEDVTYE